MKPSELTDEQIAEDIMNNDTDPLEAIRDIRREEGVAEEDLPPLESEVLEDIVDDKPADKDDEELEALKPDADADADADKDNEESEDDKAAAAAAETANAAIEAADKAADKAAGKEVEEDDSEGEKTEAAEAEEGAEKGPASRTFKANNQEFTFTEAEILEQFETVFGQAMNYTQKMQKIAPYRKMISALEQEGVTHDTLNMALDALKGDKGAIKKMLELAKVDAYDLTSENEDSAPYIPGSYGKN
jgi:hypothetical protein